MLSIIEHHFYEEGGTPNDPLFGTLYKAPRGKNCPIWYWEMNDGFERTKPGCMCPPGWPKLEASLGTLRAVAITDTLTYLPPFATMN